MSKAIKAKPSQDITAGARFSQQLTKNATNISGTVLDLQRRLKELEEDIKGDDEGRIGFETYMAELTRKRDELVKRTEANQKWISNFATDVGPFQQKYLALCQEIHGVYDNAKEFHAKGIEMLIKEFAYHPAFKRFNDTFTATPFKPL